jgi:ribosomal protein S18 acetylase RimI-like enzyme
MVKIRLARENEHRASLRLLLARPDLSAAKLEAQVATFLDYIREQELRVGPHLVAEQDGHLITSGLAIQSGGRTAMVIVPNAALFPDTKPPTVELLIEIVRQAPDHNLRLLQTLVDVDAHEDETVFADAGFSFLATLLYMDAPLNHASTPPPDDLTWITYSPLNHTLFTQTIAQTYQDSLDCRGLNGLRTMEEVIASHKASGHFDPNFWYVAKQQQHPVGVLLLAQVPNRPAWEIVYMGVLPDARGKRIGDALIKKARQVAADRASKTLTLAVDNANLPALNLYQANGFRSSGSRRAWITVTDSHNPKP